MDTTLNTLEILTAIEVANMKSNTFDNILNTIRYAVFDSLMSDDKTIFSTVFYIKNVALTTQKTYSNVAFDCNQYLDKCKLLNQVTFA